MADQVALKAATGRELGSSSARRLRKEGKIPGVVYGLTADPVAVSLEYAEARKALTTDAGLNALLNLEIDGNAELCLVKDLQRHVVRDEVTHIDFLRVDPKARIELEVPLVLTGESREVANVSGIIDQTLFTITVATLPTTIPNEIVVDISDMAVGDSIRVEDLILPDGVEPAMRLGATVATAMVTRSTLEAIRAEEAAELAAEEGEGAEGAAAEDDAGEGDSADGED